ncbi:hypothetical protein JK358_22685 [Nocardia sp. 2]|uniref:Clp R domain-containing protein n=1 Tax=Nocardia acididurans TaxID=2802282 RepID=A0ABS1M993_9NOCA|nr:Clp protease N-terminal domain-containing protein [Nocardia acididurans]MBL1077210.1 hypothetical protein [Nocardia acididurans]
MSLLGIGAGEARRLGHSWIGVEHTLLGILRGDPEDTARKALERAGVDVALVESELTAMGDAEDGVDTVSPNPRWYEILGRAEGIALALGAGDPTTVHFILATLWDSRRWVLTETPGVTRSEIVTALRDLGVELPRAALPHLERRVEMRTYVEFPVEALEPVLGILAERHPPGKGPTWGFNYKDDDTACVRAEAGIDVQAIVDEATARLDVE